MKRIILSLLLVCFCVTSTFGAVAHLCPGCQPNSDVVCTMHQSSSVEKESCHTPVKTKTVSCCESSDSAQESNDCELCADIEEPVKSEKHSETKPKSKFQFEGIVAQTSPFPTTFTPEKNLTILKLRSFPLVSSLTFLKMIRLLC